MKLLLLCFSLLFFTSCAAQKTKKRESELVKKDLFSPRVCKEPLASINIIDRNGLTETLTSKDRLKPYESTNFLSSQPYQKVLRIFAKDKLGQSFSIITTYHGNGQVKEYLEMTNGRACGFYCQWHANGKKKLLAKVIAGPPDVDEKSQSSWSFDGDTFAWDEEARLVTKIPYTKGVLEGVALYYHTNGAVLRTAPYLKGELHGIVKTFSKEGVLIESSEYKNGALDGPTIAYSEKQQLMYQEKYQNNLLEEASYYDPVGKIIHTISQGNGVRCLYDEKGPCELYEYKNGKAEGKVTILLDNTHPICTYFLKDDQKHGQEIRYYPPKPFAIATQLAPKLSIDWYEGKIHGVVKTWYDNGVQESQKEMSQNAKQGLLTSWYRNGNLMLIEEYEKDRLIRGKYVKMGENSPVTQIENGKGIASLYDSDGNFNCKVRYKDGKPLED